MNGFIAVIMLHKGVERRLWQVVVNGIVEGYRDEDGNDFELPEPSRTWVVPPGELVEAI